MNIPELLENLRTVASDLMAELMKGAPNVHLMGEYIRLMADLMQSIKELDNQASFEELKKEWDW